MDNRKGLLGIRRMEIRELRGMRRVWKMTELLRGSMYGSVLSVTHWVGRVRKKVWISGKQGELCLIGVYGGGL